MDAEINPHQVLGLSQDATPDEIRAKYLQLVREFPPDRQPERFREIHNAYQAINDPMLQAIGYFKSIAERPDLNNLIDTAARKPAILPKLVLLALGN